MDFINLIISLINVDDNIGFNVGRHDDLHIQSANWDQIEVAYR